MLGKDKSSSSFNLFTEELRVSVPLIELFGVYDKRFLHGDGINEELSDNEAESISQAVLASSMQKRFIGLKSIN